MIQIKKTKSVEMNYDQDLRGVWVELENVFYGNDALGRGDKVFIPLSKVFQVKRGLETAVQKYYRKHDKRK